jgi:hypothetical protein
MKEKMFAIIAVVAGLAFIIWFLMKGKSVMGSGGLNGTANSLPQTGNVDLGNGSSEQIDMSSGWIVSNTDKTGVVTSVPVTDEKPNPITATVDLTSQYDIDMINMAQNSPELLTADELKKYSGQTTIPVITGNPNPVVYSGGQNSDAPFNIINGQLEYV